MEHSNENTEENRISEEVKVQRSFNKRMLIVVIALIVFIGAAIYLSVSTSEPKIMAPGPLGSTNSVTQPLL